MTFTWFIHKLQGLYLLNGLACYRKSMAVRNRKIGCSLGRGIQGDALDMKSATFVTPE